MPCPIDRVPHTMAFDFSVMVTLRERPSAARVPLRLDPTTLGLQSENDTPMPAGRPYSEIRLFLRMAAHLLRVAVPGVVVLAHIIISMIM